MDAPLVLAAKFTDRYSLPIPVTSPLLSPYSYIDTTKYEVIMNSGDYAAFMKFFGDNC